MLDPSLLAATPLTFSKLSQSLVELKILKALGKDSLPDWKITAPRRRFTPRTRAGKDVMIIDEVSRMKAYAMKTGGKVDSMHINGPVPYATVIPTN